MKKIKHIKVATLIKCAVVMILLCVGIKYYGVFDPDTIVGFVNKYGVIAPVCFILVCSFRPVLFFVPTMGLSIVAGVLFGPVWGTVYVVIGGAFSTCVGFYFARWIGKDAVQRFYGSCKSAQKLDDWLRLQNRTAILSMRFFNIPWDLVSYWAGCSKIKFKDFYLASLVALIPMSFLYTYFGSRIFSPHSRGFKISLVLMFALGMIPFIRKKLQNQKTTI
ncbi:MAG: TVP38/TMEM64 family protein [Candidatus Omnitrophica bacterium]|nr:TVP38/TMEM64 family protein [Candidatus Omnitrophota bacterium]